MKILNFYFYCVSNNAYLAWTQLRKISDEYQVQFNPVPVLFAGLLNAHGNVGPAEIPAKRAWMLKNILRKSAALGVPMNPPIHHPFNPLLALRVSSLDVGSAERWELIDILFKAVWVDQQHVSDEGVVIELLNKVGLDGQQLIAQAQLDITKNSLKAQTEMAIAKGVFGIPSILLDDEVFFGFDDFSFLQNVLKGEDPLDEQVLSKWSLNHLTPSSQRSRS